MKENNELIYDESGSFTAEKKNIMLDDEIETGAIPNRNNIAGENIIPVPPATPNYPIRNVFRYFQMPEWTPTDPENRLKPDNKPGFFESVYHEYENWTMLGENIRSYQKNQALAVDNPAFKSADAEDMSDEFDPFSDIEIYRDIGKQYWDVVSTATSAQDQKNRIAYAKSQMENDEYFGDRSLIQNIMTKTAAVPAIFLLDPYGWAPLSVGFKYTKLTTTALKAIAQAVPTIAATSAVAESVNFGLDPDIKVEDLGINALRDTVMGSLLIGAGAGLGRGMTGYKAYKSKNLMNETIEGVGAKFNVDDKGRLLSLTAYPLGDTSVGAAKVKEAQTLLDLGMKEHGLFYLPFIGTAAKKGSMFLSPVMRGLNSPWKTVRSFTPRMKQHDISTVNGNEVLPAVENFEDTINTMQANLVKSNIELEAFRKSYNGIDLTLQEKESLQKFSSSFNKQDPLDASHFGRRVASAMISDLNNQGIEIDGAKALTRDFFNNIYLEHQKSLGIKDAIPDVMTGEGYFPQVANKDELSSRRTEAFEVIKSELLDQERMIDELVAPINSIKEKINKVQQDIKSGIDLEENRRSLIRLRKEKENAINEQHQKIWDNSDNRVLLQDRVLLSPEERTKLKKLFSPIIKKKNAKTKASNALNNAQKELSLLNFKLESPAKKGTSKSKIKQQHAEIMASIKEREKEIAILRNTRDKHEREYLDEEAVLRGRAQNGEISDRFFYVNPETKLIQFADYKKPPTLRQKFADESDIDIRANAIIDDYLGLSPEDLISSHMGNFDSSPNNLKKRSVMLRSRVMMDNGFLNSNIPLVMQMYSHSIGKKTAVNKALAGMYEGKYGMEGALQSLLDEKIERINQTKKLSDHEASKAQKKIQKEYAKAVSYMQNLHDALIGKIDGNETVRFWTGAAKTLSAAVRLTFTPLTQIADIGAINFKHGMWRYISTGLKPAITTFHGLANGPNAEHYRALAKELGVAVQHVRMQNFSDSYYNENYSSNYKRVSIEWLERLAHKSANWSLMNRIDNLQQSIVAQIGESRLLEAANKAIKGTLSKKEKEYFNRRGIDIDAWAKRFTKQQRKHKKKGESDYSYVYRWDDLEARNKFNTVVRNIIKDSILQTSPGDMPLSLRNPLLSSMFQFMGYSFNAFNRFTVPLAQRGYRDMDMITGTFIMATLAAMEGVTRKLARGEEVDWEDENFMLEAFSNSAPFSLLYKTTMMANGLSGGALFDSLRNDKYKKMSILGTSGGPAVGILGDFSRFINMAMTGNFNQQDWNKTAKLIPFLNMWHSSAIIQKGLNQVYDYYQIPETPKEATSYYEKLTE